MYEKGICPVCRLPMVRTVNGYLCKTCGGTCYIVSPKPNIAVPTLPEVLDGRQ